MKKRGMGGGCKTQLEKKQQFIKKLTKRTEMQGTRKRIPSLKKKDQKAKFQKREQISQKLW